MKKLILLVLVVNISLLCFTGLLGRPALQASSHSLPPLMATEEEVRQFFSRYVEAYNRMDLEGFLSQFSPRAMQNQQHGFEVIQKIYADFFNQGQAIRYRLQDLKFEIYQNGVEVKARYTLNQVMKNNGEEQTWRGQIRWVLVKENGALKIQSLVYKHEKSP